MNNNIKLLIKVKGTEEFLDEYIEYGELILYMQSDILTYTCFGELDEPKDYKVVCKKYNPCKRIATITIEEIKNNDNYYSNFNLNNFIF